jgi:hypothetical protein
MHRRQLGLGHAELAFPFRRIDLNRKRDRGPQQQPLGSDLRDQLVVGLESERLSQLGRQSDYVAAGGGDGWL